eukprot:TRINITY_DN37830_c0_g1_i1.p1 TRINITY_DN37830_c0_g1~~TRINITY_DN37830_c0_g1_i1.p1  ORF type:complete len:592 (+),score=149.87 TRINITY_DN37830_c0_g1_i1:124-1899(+)
MTETATKEGSAKKHGRHSKFNLRGSTPWAPPPQVAAQPLPRWASKRYEKFLNGKNSNNKASPSSGTSTPAPMEQAPTTSRNEDDDVAVASAGELLTDNCKIRLNTTSALSRILDEELRDFMCYMELTSDEKKTRQDIANRVKSCTAEVFPDSTLEVFGSWSTDLCIPSSDIDFTLCGVEASQAYALSSTLQQNGFTTHLITNTKVPLIRLTDVVSGVHADISFNMKRAAASAANMKRLLRKYRLARPMIITLKNILKLGNVNELYTGGLSSYSLCLMVVSYLQHVHDADIEEEEDENECDSSGDSEASSAEMSTNSGSSSAERSDAAYKGLGAAFVGFLETFGMEPGALNLEDITISVAEARYKPRSEAECNSMVGSQLSLEDPLSVDNDVARGTFRFVDVRMLFSATLRMLKCYEHFTRTWEEKKNMRNYQYAPPPPTPLMAVFGCDPREWNPMWGQPHPLSWRHNMVVPWGSQGVPTAGPPQAMVQQVSPAPLVSPESPLAAVNSGNSLFGRMKVDTPPPSATVPVPPQPQPLKELSMPPATAMHQTANPYQPPFRHVQHKSSNSTSSSEGLTRSSPDAASSSDEKQSC